jgi:hypothetical protein
LAITQGVFWLVWLWLHPFWYFIFIFFDEFWVIQINVKCCIYICVNKWHLIVSSSFPHIIRSCSSNDIMQKIHPIFRIDHKYIFKFYIPTKKFN